MSFLWGNLPEIWFSNGFMAWLNTFLAIIDALLVGFLTLYSVERFFQRGWAPAVRLALALDLFIVGQFVIRTWTGIWRYEAFRHIPTLWMNSYPTLVIGALITLIGAVMCVRVLLTPELKWWVWGLLIIGLCLMSVAPQDHNFDHQKNKNHVREDLKG